MKKHIIPILIALFVLLCACENEDSSVFAANGISVYRVLRPEYQTGGELLRTEKVFPDTYADSLKEAVTVLNEPPQSDKLQNPISKGVKILDAELDGNCVTVYMNSAYLDVTGIDKSTTDCCITLTMCSIDNVDYVSICVGSEVIADKLSTENYLLFDTITSSNSAQVQLYFPKAAGRTLGAEYHTVSYDDDNSAERCILDAIFSGPTSSSLKRAFPTDTNLLSVYTQDGICTVNLSDFSSAVAAPASTDAELAFYSLANSLTAIAGVDSVQILIEGKQVQDFWGFDISRPLTKNESLIGSSAAG